jgi:hypothetical protein
MRRLSNNNNIVINKTSNNLEKNIDLRNSIGTIKTKGFGK